MKRVTMLLAVVVAALVLASGVALAANRLGTNGPDTLRGTNDSDNLVGRGGNDDLFALAGNDNLLGGSGRDNLLGGDERGEEGGDKNLNGGPGNDVVNPGVGSDRAFGEGGNDLLVEPNFREASRDTYFGGPGRDVILANNKPAAQDIVQCGEGFDRVLADVEDIVAPDCERTSLGVSDQEFFDTVPRSFFDGLPPPPEGLSG